jgi:hypothetical protein
MSTKKSTAAAEVEPVAETDVTVAAMEATAGAATADDEEKVLTLELADLVSDSNGEVVLYNDSHLPSLAVRAASPPIESGALGSHVTAAGDDVTGYRYVAFDNGTKLIFQDSVDLVIVGANGELHV